MAEKKQESFTVTDRRLFTPDGEVRREVEQEEASTSTRKVEPPAPKPPEHNAPPAPSAAEQQKQADEYRKSAKSVDRRVELSGHSAKDLEMTFERFVASLYMTAMLQLGLMHEQGGEPQVDLIGARQTIDTLSMLSEKTKSNLTSAEENLLQNCLYELRMAYVEVTNVLARPPQATGTDSVKR
ncbi:MAG TPA: DUF1844 domain-containing protein [Terriglobales bacterium]|nr:DUF1844 domain-containing protein [Terriglobales bacterium]